MTSRWVIIFLFLGSVVGFPSRGAAVTIEADEMRLGINGFLNVVYEQIGEMAVLTSDGTAFETRSDSSTFENDTHLLFNAVQNRFRANLNVTFHNGYVSEGRTVAGADETTTRGELELLEVFGAYTFGPLLQVRGGHFLSHYGIYNHLRHVTSMFAPVELPMIYEGPENYRGSDLAPTWKSTGVWPDGGWRSGMFSISGTGETGPPTGPIGITIRGSEDGSVSRRPI